MKASEIKTTETYRWCGLKVQPRGIIKPDDKEVFVYLPELKAHKWVKADDLQQIAIRTVSKLQESVEQ
jgi:hypothetical protein